MKLGKRRRCSEKISDGEQETEKDTLVLSTAIGDGSGQLAITSEGKILSRAVYCSI